jgi:SAM-dependent methyltransferase
MTLKKNQIIQDQKAFFNANALLEKTKKSSSLFDAYVNKEQKEGFSWLSDCQRLLDYGCGTGTSIDFFYKTNPGSAASFIGVDIADNAIKKINEIYPRHEFHLIENNQLPSMQDRKADGAYLLHVLHHSREHQEVFNAIYAALQPGGKFFLSDLSSGNPFIAGARSIFTLLPNWIKNKFLDDLVVDGSIPDKYPVNISEVLYQLRAAGFKIEKVGYGHLYCFLFDWLERFAPLSKFRPIYWLYKKLMHFEQYLLTRSFFQRRAEVFYILCNK